jgi:tRNA threonylcarbamoyladenosine biosynthesis protein TsaB
VAAEGKVIARLLNPDHKDHASWIHLAIDTLLKDNSLKSGQLDAIAVTAGPGSYTGIRVGMASAKGLAYALSIPLIVENTLKVMAWSQQHLLEANSGSGVSAPVPCYYCPMIDARRDEVFTAIYDEELNEVVEPSALGLTAQSFESELAVRQVKFFGNGSEKWERLTSHENARFPGWDYEYFNLAYLSYQSYRSGNFADLAYVIPYYLKEVYTYKRK